RSRRAERSRSRRARRRRASSSRSPACRRAHPTSPTFTSARARGAAESRSRSSRWSRTGRETPTPRPSSAPPTRPQTASGTPWSTRYRTCRARTRNTCSAATCPRGHMTPERPTGEQHQAEVVELPVAPRATDIALDELELVYAFIYARVGNRADAEDLTQQVAMKAIPRLRQGAPASAIRGYLFATARSVLGAFWSTRLGLSEAELREDLVLAVPTSGYSEESVERVGRILEQLSDNYRRVLELRFLHGYSLKEVAA